MTAQELIDELMLLPDKSKTVVIRTCENRGYETVSYVAEVNAIEGPYIAIWRE